MKQNLTHFCLHVSDMDKTIEFYRDKLGFEVEYQTDAWSELKLNDKVNLALQKSSKPGSGIGFVVDDCATATKILEGRGVEITTNCEKLDENNNITRFVDPDGNVIWMTEKIK